ncbi:MAG: tRNA (adenosine(37)-N6)-threonylcarbamoyltransferase complex transferase subunit TsaD [Myxococcales bacterium]|nr:tRNA (adenosine(37)-N6)-threonylcarbamoyltransferase complex transferase subunit TsaD [Myxococcales bacterium]
MTPPANGPVLGIETSCDETAVAAVQAGRVLASRIASQVPIHARFGGVVPEVAARNHLLSILPTLEGVMAEAHLTPADVRGLAVTNRPGLVGALLVGVQTAKTLALAWRLPVVGIDHIEAHVWASMLCPPAAPTDRDWPRPRLPFLALAVSGGHTSLYQVEAPGRMTLLGRTLDDAAGEAFDKVARHVGLPYPGGPHLDACAQLGDATRFRLPRGLAGRDDLAFSFSGLKTAARLLVDGLGGADALDVQTRADVCAAFQAAAVEQLVRVTLRAARRHGLGDVVVAGGVAANAGLRAGLAQGCADAGFRFWPVPPAWCTDNAAMVAGLGEALLDAGLHDDPHDLDATPTGRQRRAVPGGAGSPAGASA